jgi:hypothetical protein
MPPTTLRLLPELEATLGRLPGIQAVRVVTGPDAKPTEVHVLATRDKTPKQLVRDIQSVAMAQFDLEVDHRIVSVVQFEDEERGVATPNRVLIESTATVTLASQGTLVDGTATAPATPSTRPRLIARATLNAVAGLMPVGACEIEYAAVVQVGGRDVAVSIVQLVTSEGESIVTGSALVRGDESDAVARSVLDALNRRLGS